MNVYMLWFAMLIFLSWMNTTYDDDLLFKKYIIIKNSKLASFLIKQIKISTVKNSRAKSKKEHRNKLLLPGLIFYISDFILLVISIILKLPDLLMASFAISQEIFYQINTFNYQLKRRKGIERAIQKWMSIFIMLILGLTSIYLLWLAIMTL